MREAILDVHPLIKDAEVVRESEKQQGEKR